MTKDRYGTFEKFPSPRVSAIKRARISSGLNQVEAAKQLKSNLSTYSKWENGVSPMHQCIWAYFKEVNGIVEMPDEFIELTEDELRARSNRQPHEDAEIKAHINFGRLLARKSGKDIDP